MIYDPIHPAEPTYQSEVITRAKTFTNVVSILFSHRTRGRRNLVRIRGEYKEYVLPENMNIDMSRFFGRCKVLPYGNAVRVIYRNPNAPEPKHCQHCGQIIEP